MRVTPRLRENARGLRFDRHGPRGRRPSVWAKPAGIPTKAALRRALFVWHLRQLRRHEEKTSPPGRKRARHGRKPSWPRRMCRHSPSRGAVASHEGHAPKSVMAAVLAQRKRPLGRTAGASSNTTTFDDSFTAPAHAVVEPPRALREKSTAMEPSIARTRVRLVKGRSLTNRPIDEVGAFRLVLGKHVRFGRDRQRVRSIGELAEDRLTPDDDDFVVAAMSAAARMRCSRCLRFIA